MLGTASLGARPNAASCTQAASKLRESDARLESLDLEFGKMRTQLHDLVATKQHLKESLQVRRVPKRNHATYNGLACIVHPSHMQRTPVSRASCDVARVGSRRDGRQQCAAPCQVISGSRRPKWHHESVIRA